MKYEVCEENLSGLYFRMKLGVLDVPAGGEKKEQC